MIEGKQAEKSVGEAHCAGGLAMERALLSVIPFSTSVGCQPKASAACVCSGEVLCL